MSHAGWNEQGMSFQPFTQLGCKETSEHNCYVSNNTTKMENDMPLNAERPVFHRNPILFYEYSSLEILVLFSIHVVKIAKYVPYLFLVISITLKSRSYRYSTCMFLDQRNFDTNTRDKQDLAYI